MKYKIDERVGCIAVVEETYNENCLSADMDGVIAYWYGRVGKNGWEMETWQIEQANALCNTLNNYTALLTAAREIGLAVYDLFDDMSKDHYLELPNKTQKRLEKSYSELAALLSTSPATGKETK